MLIVFSIDGDFRAVYDGIHTRRSCFSGAIAVALGLSGATAKAFEGQ